MTLRPVALAGLLLVALAGCSGDDTTSDTTADTTGTPLDEAAAEVVTSEPATTAPATTAPATTAPAANEFDDWCGLAIEVEAVDTLGDELDPTDPAAIEEYFAALLPLLDEAVAAAPDEIADAVRVSAEIAGEANEALVAVDYDLLAVDLSAVTARDTENDAATEAIERFNEAQCGIPRDSDDVADDVDDDGFDPSQGSLRDQFIADLVTEGFTEDEATCIFSEIDFSDMPSLQDPVVITAIFDACEISLERLAEISSVVPGGVGDADLFGEAFVAVLIEEGFTEDEATCILAELGDVDAATDGDTIAAMDACGITASRIAELMGG